jgi:glycosyl hydrolase family 79
MRRRSRRRFVLIDLVLVALVAAITAVAVSVSSGSRGVPDDAAKLTVESIPYGRPVQAGFLGLSLEYSSVEQYAGTNPAALNPVFERLVANLNPGQAPVLRIGGDTTDWTWWPVHGVTKPAGVTYSLTDRWVQVTRALTEALGARLILGVNLEANSTEIAGTEARKLVDGLGRESVQALELGNEPALYGSFPWYRTASGRKVPGRPRGYDAPAYIRDFDRFSAALPSVPLAGPALGASKWMRNLGPFLSSQPRLGVVTMHRYPLQLCYTSTKSPMHPSLPHLMATAATTGLADSFARDVAAAHAHRLPLRVDEINSVSCGAVRAISDTFASGLWAVDAMFELARVGVDGVNLHTFPGAGYELFRIAHRGGRWTAAVSPEYYGLILFARAAPPGSRLLRVSGQASSQIKTWATRASNGTIHVIAINKGNADRDLAIRLPASRHTATLQRLLGPSLTASSGVTFAGQSFGEVTDTGDLSGARDVESVKATGGRYVVHLPAASAALLTTG